MNVDSTLRASAVAALLALTGAEARADIYPEVAVEVGGRTVQVGGPSRTGEVALRLGDVTATAIALTGWRHDRVTEVVATRWRDGVALAVEAVSPERGRSYWWATAALEGDALRPVAAARFLDDDDPRDLDLVGVVNSTGDSIYVILARHDRPTPNLDDVAGYIFVHNCPVGAVPGTLLRLEADPRQR